MLLTKHIIYPWMGIIKIEVFFFSHLSRFDFQTWQVILRKSLNEQLLTFKNNAKSSFRKI